MSLSVIAAQRDILLEAIKNTARGEWKVLVLDEKSRKILDNVLDLDDVLNYDISFVEDLDKPRAQGHGLDAIYLLTPRPDVFDRLTADLQKRQYPSCSLIWTSIPPETYRKFLITTEYFKSQISTYKVLNVEFFPQESHLVTFRDPWETTYLFHPVCAGIVQKHVEDMAQKIVGVCVALGEYPIIRYYQPRPETSELIDAARAYKTTQPSREFRFLVESLQPVQWSCLLLARFVQDELDLYAKFHEDFPPQNSRPRGILYITDRTMDVVAPLLHEFTYQAMIFDLLPIHTGEKLQYKTVVNEGQPTQETKWLPIEEKDPLWTQYRHKHMKDTLDGLNNEFQKYTKANAVFTQQPTADDPGSLHNLRKMMAGLPEYQSQKEQYALHLSMLQEAMKLFVDRDLKDMALLEQSLANGLDEDSKKPKNTADELVRLLDDDKIIPLDRLRLLVLYMNYKDGLLPADLIKLIAHSKIQSSKIERVRNFDLLGCNVERNLKEKRERPSPVFQSLEPTPVAVPETHAIGRYKTQIELLLERHNNNRIDDEVFPYTRPPLDDGDDPVAAAAATSLRTAKATWASKRTKPSAENKQRVLVYMAAGATYSESRACYNASQKHGKEVVLISSHMLSTDLYLRQIGHLTEHIAKLEPPKCMAELRERRAPPLDQRAMSAAGQSPPQSRSSHPGPMRPHQSPPKQHRQMSSSSVPQYRQSSPSPQPSYAQPSMMQQQQFSQPLNTGMSDLNINGDQHAYGRPTSTPYPQSSVQGGGLFPPPMPTNSMMPPPIVHHLDKKATEKLAKSEAKDAKARQKAEKKKSKTGLFGKSKS